MATQDDVRQIALSLPKVTEDTSKFAFVVSNKGKPKGIAWVWLECVHPKKARVPNPQVIAIPVSNLGEKELLLAANPYPAILVRLADVSVDELRSLLVNAWFCAAPATLIEKYKQITDSSL